MTLCVLAAAAVQTKFQWVSLYVSDYKYGFETMGLTCPDRLLHFTVTVLKCQKSNGNGLETGTAPSQKSSLSLGAEPE